jgi:hypothetical protein
MTIPPTIKPLLPWLGCGAGIGLLLGGPIGLVLGAASGGLLQYGMAPKPKPKPSLPGRHLMDVPRFIYVQLVQASDGSTMDIVKVNSSLLPMIQQAAQGMGATVNTAATIGDPSLPSRNVNDAAEANVWLALMASHTTPTSNDQLDDTPDA